MPTKLKCPFGPFPSNFLDPSLAVIGVFSKADLKEWILNGTKHNKGIQIVGKYELASMRIY